MRRGSFSIEASIVMAVLLLVLMGILYHYRVAFELLQRSWQDTGRYEQAFQEKVREVILQKIHREKR